MLICNSREGNGKIMRIIPDSPSCTSSPAGPYFENRMSIPVVSSSSPGINTNNPSFVLSVDKIINRAQKCHDNKAQCTATFLLRNVDAEEEREKEKKRKIE